MMHKSDNHAKYTANQSPESCPDLHPVRSESPYPTYQKSE